MTELLLDEVRRRVKEHADKERTTFSLAGIRALLNALDVTQAARPSAAPDDFEKTRTLRKNLAQPFKDNDAPASPSAEAAQPVADDALAAYRAENAKHGWTGRGLSFDGGCLNLGKDGSAEFVFDMDDCDPYYEEGKSLMLAKVPASEIEFLRDYLVKAFPATLASPSAEAAQPVAQPVALKRYGLMFMNGAPYIGEKANGGYVNYNDVAALAQPQGELREALEELQSALSWWDIRPDINNQNKVFKAARNAAAALTGRTAG
jgi:hypothetical protein